MTIFYLFVYYVDCGLYIDMYVYIHVYVLRASGKIGLANRVTLSK